MVVASAASLRAACTGQFGGRARSYPAVDWNPASPAAGVDAIRDAVGSVDSVAICVEADLVRAVRVSLPPAPHDSREAMVSLEPDRFFVADEPLAVGLAPGGDLAFALPVRLVDSWLSAFGVWAPVARIEPAATAIARAPSAPSEGVFELPAPEGMRSVVAVHEGNIAAVRFGSAELVNGPAAQLPGGPDGPFQLAVAGALAADDADQSGTLWGAAPRAGARRRALRSVWTAALAATAALVIAAAGYDHWRSRTLLALTAEAETLTNDTEPAMRARQRLDALVQEWTLLAAAGARRNDPAATLAALGHVLPEDAVVLSATATGSQWRIEGTASNAAAVVPLLDRAGTFRDVRSIGASSRFVDRGRPRETFTISFRAGDSD
ncbi:MAG: hypothetical protein ACT4OZ_14600 [Gemmatimonadota bacterium]